MNTRYFKVLLLFVVFLFLGVLVQESLAKGKNKHSPEYFLKKRKMKAPLCKGLSSKCAICSDGKMRASTRKGSKELRISSYACATRGTPLWNGKRVPASKKGLFKNKCRVLSDFCAVCKDNSYIFVKNGIKIDTDLYACATSPRTSYKSKK